MRVALKYNSIYWNVLACSQNVPLVKSRRRKCELNWKIARKYAIACVDLFIHQPCFILRSVSCVSCVFACATCLRQTSLQSEIDDIVPHAKALFVEQNRAYVYCGYACVLNVRAEWLVSWSWRRWWWWLWQLLKYFCIGIRLNCIFPFPCENPSVYGLHAECNGITRVTIDVIHVLHSDSSMHSHGVHTHTHQLRTHHLDFYRLNELTTINRTHKRKHMHIAYHTNIWHRKKWQASSFS